MAQDLEKTWAQGGGEAKKLYGGKGDLRSFSILSVNLSAVWQLDPDETIICVVVVNTITFDILRRDRIWMMGPNLSRRTPTIFRYSETSSL